MSSDNVLLLSHTSNILAGVTYTSEKVILGQYISLNILPKSDVDLSIVLQFSGDGSNWDYSVTSTVAAGGNTVISNPVQAKWMRITVTNSSGANSTYLRVFVYGTPSNSSITAQIGKIGNLNPEVDLGNLPISYANPNPIATYTFQSVNTSLTSANNIQCQHYDLKVKSTITTPGAQVTGGNTLIKLINNNKNSLDDVLGTTHNLTGDYYVVRFVARFVYTTDSLNGGTTLVGTSSSYGDRFSFGFQGTLDYDHFGIYQSPSGGGTFIPRTSWNVDKCDGTYIVPVLDPATCLAYQIVIGYNMVNYYILYDSKYRLVHRYTFDGSVTNVMMRDTSCGLFMRTFMDATGEGSATLGNLEAHCAYWALIELGGVERKRIKGLSYSRTMSGITSEAAIFTLQNYAIMGAYSYLKTVVIDSISAACNTGGATITVRLYLNATLGGTPAYSAVSPYSNVRVDTAGTTVTGGVLIKTFYVTNSSTPFDMSDYVALASGGTLTISVQDSGGSSASVAACFY